MSKETKQFQTEVKQILDLMVHSVYSQREIFLRELISNGSDALDKLRYEENTNSKLASPEEKLIRLVPDKDAKTLTIIDNGIGMTYDEVVQNIGTIAYSGSKDFINKLKAAKESPDLIGQFGVGFYSAFMVADKVTLHTRKAGTDECTLWESNGDGSYAIEKTPKDGWGTTITLHLKTFPEEENAQDFTDTWTLKQIVRKYSDFIGFPIKMRETREEPETDQDGKPIEGKTKEVTEDLTLNSRKALWQKSSSEVKSDEYTEFYKHLTHDWNPPQEHIHYRAEGTQEFTALVYVPSQVPFDYHHRDMKHGLSLYVRRVFIMDRCEDLIPHYMRFLKGLVDSSDLPLNVSREILQKDRRLEAIKKAVVSKVLRHFKQMLEKKRDDYETMWKNFGSSLKEGIPTDHANKDAVIDLSLFRSSASDKWTTLKEYVGRMKPEQKGIYYITGDSIDQLANSPYLERLKAKGFEVLYGVDPVDEWVLDAIADYDDKKLLSITKENLELDSEEEKKEREEKRKEKSQELEALTTTIKGALDEHIKEVKVSDRLVDSPACLVSGANDPSAHMERMMEAMGQSMPKSKRILEINPDHPVFTKMANVSEDRQKTWAQILYNQALLNEGSTLEDPMAFSRQISELMMSAN